MFGVYIGVGKLPFRVYGSGFKDLIRDSEFSVWDLFFGV